MILSSLVQSNNIFEIINNAIDYDNFKFDEDKRKSIRKELQLDNGVFVVGHVGRFDYQKNHKFIVENILMNKKQPTLLL